MRRAHGALALQILDWGNRICQGGLKMKKVYAMTGDHVIKTYFSNF